MTCPICYSELTRKPDSHPTQYTIITVKGAKWNADFGFYKVYSIRGFKCFLVLVEAVSDHAFAFCRRNKMSPVELVRWFILRVRLHLQYPFTNLRVDHAGELYNNTTFRETLSKIHCHVESTGGYASNVNGRAERTIGKLGTSTQCLLYGGVEM